MVGIVAHGSEASRADVQDIGEEHGHRVLLVHGKGGKETLVHADPRTTMRYDRARKDLDRHPDYILAPTRPQPPEPSPRGHADERMFVYGLRWPCARDAEQS
jgi:hypothetical protein